MLVGVLGQLYKGICRRVIPEMIGREVLSGRRVEHPTCFIRQPEWQPRSFPLFTKPHLHSQGPIAHPKRCGLNIMDANFGDYWELA